MGFIKNKKFIIFSLILLLLLIVSFLTLSVNKTDVLDSEDPVLDEKTSPRTENSIFIDFDGDGTKEILNFTEVEGEVFAREVNMEAFDYNGNKIAELLDRTHLYPTSLYKIVKLNENSNKEYLQWDMLVGPHQIETTFLTLFEGKVYPLYSADLENNTIYTPFYTSRGELTVADFNGDGLVEVIENVDEYPVNAPRLEDPDIDSMISEQFSAQGLDSELIEGFTEIVKRENYGKGRGRKTILAIHSFVDGEEPHFRRLPSDEYEEIAGRLIAASQEVEKKAKDSNSDWESESLVRYSDLDQDSKDFNDFVRYFWTRGRPYVIELPE